MKLKFIFIYFLIGIIGSVTFISCVDNDDYSIPPVPPTGFFKETFNKAAKANGDPITSSPWPKIAAVINFDGELEGAAYEDTFGLADIRKLNGSNDIAKKENFLWFPGNKEASLTIHNIPVGKRKNLTLRYRFNANIYNPGEISNTNKLIVKFNDVELVVPNIELNTINNKNKYKGVLINIPNELLQDNSKLEFIGDPSNNDRGFRIDDIEIIENYPL